MSMLTCQICWKPVDTDFHEILTIDGLDVCEACLVEVYQLCDICDNWYDPDLHDECPSVICNKNHGFTNPH